MLCTPPSARHRAAHAAARRAMPPLTILTMCPLPSLTTCVVCVRVCVCVCARARVRESGSEPSTRSDLGSRPRLSAARWPRRCARRRRRMSPRSCSDSSSSSTARVAAPCLTRRMTPMERRPCMPPRPSTRRARSRCCCSPVPRPKLPCGRGRARRLTWLRRMAESAVCSCSSVATSI